MPPKRVKTSSPLLLIKRSAASLVTVNDQRVSALNYEQDQIYQSVVLIFEKKFEELKIELFSVITAKNERTSSLGNVITDLNKRNLNHEVEVNEILLR